MVDNLTDALMMAGAILIFVIALAVSMSSFTEMRTQIDTIVEMESKIDLVKDNNNKYLNYYMTDNASIRTVGIETLVSSMYKVAKENYVIYIKLEQYDDLYTKRTTTVSEKLTDSKGVEIIGKNDDVLYIDINGKNSNINEFLKDCYSELKSKKFKEYLGVYQEKSEANEANKTTYRVITYVER